MRNKSEHNEYLYKIVYERYGKKLPKDIHDEMIEQKLIVQKLGGIGVTEKGLQQLHAEE